MLTYCANRMEFDEGLFKNSYFTLGSDGKKNAETMSCNNHARILHGMRLLVFRRKKREDEGRFEIN